VDRYDGFDDGGPPRLRHPRRYSPCPRGSLAIGCGWSCRPRRSRCVTALRWWPGIGEQSARASRSLIWTT